MKVSLTTLHPRRLLISEGAEYNITRPLKILCRKRNFRLQDLIITKMIELILPTELSDLKVVARTCLNDLFSPARL